MSTHDDRTLGDKISDAGKDLRDTVNEHTHRAEADAEHAKRDVAGNEMSTGDKVRSGVEELKDRGKAEIDHAKRDARDRT